jgi:hypothetical protein
MKSQQLVFRITTSDSRTITLAALTARDYDEWVRTLYWASTQDQPPNMADDHQENDLTLYSEEEMPKSPDGKKSAESLFFEKPRSAAKVTVSDKEKKPSKGKGLVVIDPKQEAS